MTFPARLTELMNNAVLHPSSLNDDELSEYLVTHAEALRDLVVAAKNVEQYLAANKRRMPALSEALAKLND